MKSSTNANLQPIYEPRVGVVMCEYTTVQYTRFLIEISVSPLVSGPPAYGLSCLVFLFHCEHLSLWKRLYGFAFHCILEGATPALFMQLT